MITQGSCESGVTPTTVGAVLICFTGSGPFRQQRLRRLPRGPSPPLALWLAESAPPATAGSPFSAPSAPSPALLLHAAAAQRNEHLAAHADVTDVNSNTRL